MSKTYVESLVPLEDVRPKEVMKLMSAGQLREIVGELGSQCAKFRTDFTKALPQSFATNVILSLVPLPEHCGPDIFVVEVIGVELTDYLKVASEHLGVQVRGRHFPEVGDIAPGGDKDGVFNKGAVPHGNALPSKEVHDSFFKLVPRRGVVELAFVYVNVVIQPIVPLGFGEAAVATLCIFFCSGDSYHGIIHGRGRGSCHG